MELIVLLLKAIGFIGFGLFGYSSLRQEGNERIESLLYAIINLLIIIVATVVLGGK
jgi:hypothetical protein